MNYCLSILLLGVLLSSAADADSAQMTNLPVGTSFKVRSKINFLPPDGIFYMIDTIKFWRKNSEPAAGDTYCAIVLRHKQLSEPTFISAGRTFVVSEPPKEIGDIYPSTEAKIMEQTKDGLIAGPIQSINCRRAHIEKGPIPSDVTPRKIIFDGYERKDTEIVEIPTLKEFNSMVSNIFEITYPEAKEAR